MSETKSGETAKTQAKPKTGKPPVSSAANKELAVKAKAAMKPEPKATAAKKPEKKSASNVADGKIKVTQLVGTIARKSDQRATLIGLGLNKRHRSKVLENTPSVRGMVYKVRHLVKVEKIG